jgi:type III restriction enzyme
VLELMSSHFAWESGIPAGTMQIVMPAGDSVECAMVLMQDWPTKLPGLLQSP